jgi:hypothetical protein
MNEKPITWLPAKDILMNASNEQILIAKLRALPPDKQAEVLDFVEFVSARASRRAALDWIVAVAPALAAAGIEPLTEAQISDEINASRLARRNNTNNG